MFATRRNLVVTAAGAALIAAVAVFPASVGSAAERVASPTLPYELDAMAPPSPTDLAAQDKPLPAVATTVSASAVDADAQRCMAKVVHHEARNQPRAGMIAVAQTLVNRLKVGTRFGGSICEIANQRGQYFDVHGYHPREDSADWQKAMDVAEATLSGAVDSPAPGALYFRAAYRPATSFFRSRPRVAAVGDQIFYR